MVIKGLTLNFGQVLTYVLQSTHVKMVTHDVTIKSDIIKEISSPLVKMFIDIC